MLRLSNTILTEVLHINLAKIGVNSLASRHLVDSIVSTSLRGTDSHGINLFPHYWTVLNNGRVNKNPELKWKQTSATLGILSADYAPGHYSGAVAMEYAIQMAAQNGSGFAVVKESTHFGAAAYFGLMAARKDMLGLAFTNADALVKAPSARIAFFGTNPICVTVPLESEEPLCLDMATSQVSWNKIRIHRSLNKALEPGWAFNDRGEPEMNPHAARCLSPSGDYKGFGLGFFVEVVCGILAQGPIGREIGPMFTDLEKKRKISHFFGAIDLSKFIPMDDFKSRLQEVVQSIRGLESMDDQNVMVPGDPEKKTFAERITNGIPMETDRFEDFLKIDPDFKRAVLL